MHAYVLRILTKQNILKQVIIAIDSFPYYIDSQPSIFVFSHSLLVNFNNYNQLIFSLHARKPSFVVADSNMVQSCPPFQNKHRSFSISFLYQTLTNAINQPRSRTCINFFFERFLLFDTLIRMTMVGKYSAEVMIKITAKIEPIMFYQSKYAHKQNFFSFLKILMLEYGDLDFE